MHMHLSRLLLSVHCFQFKRESYDEKLVTAVAQCAFIDYGAILNKFYYINCSVLQGFVPPRNVVSEHT